MLHLSSSFVEFIRNSDNKVAKAIYKSYTRDYNNAINVNEVNYLTFRNDGTISFLPAGKNHVVNEDDTWNRQNRQNGKPSKVVRKLFNARALKIFKESDFEAFSNEYKAKFTDKGLKFVLRINKDIPEVYCMDRVNEGTIGNSCMNGDSSYLELYENCEQLSILTLINKDGVLCGRSLIWGIDSEITLMDRVYVSEDYMYELFLNYCSDKKWWRKSSYKTYDYKTSFVNPSGEVINRNFTINTDTDCSYYPYIDTFTYGNDGSISNYSGDYAYTNTDGTREGDEEIDEHENERYDDLQDCYIDEDDAIEIDGGSNRYRNRITHVNNAVVINERWYYTGDDNYIVVDNEGDYRLIDDVCDVGGRYYDIDDCVFCEESDEYILLSDAVEVEGNWYHKHDHLDDVIVQLNNGDYRRKDDENIVEIDCEWYHKTDDLDDTICILDDVFVLFTDDVVEVDDNYFYKTDTRIIEVDGEFIMKQLELILA